METQTVPDGQPAPPGVRGCDGCTLCCKMMGVPALSKPANAWCPHCRTGSGCGIYDTRPTECRTFQCGYLLMPGLTPEWKPATSRLIIIGSGGNRINIRVDPGRPDAWRRQPFYRVMKEWAAMALREHKQVVVTIAQRSIVLLPDRDVDLGTVGADEVITVIATPAAGGSHTYEAYAVKAGSHAGGRISAADGRPVQLASGPGPDFRPGRTLP
jgi:hypothetical protein